MTVTLLGFRASLDIFMNLTNIREVMGGARSGDSSERLHNLHHAATYILSATDETAVYERAVETAEEVLGFDYCTVLVSNDSEFVVVASSHLERGDRISGERGVLEETFGEGDGILTRDIAASEVANPANPDYRSGVSVPIGDEAVLQAISESPDHYDEHDLELAELLTLHADAALSQVRSEEQIRDQKRKIEELHAVSTELESCHTHDELYALMRRASKEILGFDWCTLYEMEDDRFVVAMASESSPMDVGEYPFPKRNSKAREIYESGESHVVEDVHELDDGEPTTDRIRGALQVAVGNIGVYNAAHERPGTFDESDLELAELLASSIAEAYERIEAQEQLREQKRELKRQNERLDRFASVVSHDLRNPLTTASIRLELAQQEESEEHLVAIGRSLDRMEAMVDQLLALTRAENVVERTETVELQELVAAAWDTSQTGAATLETAFDESHQIEGEPDILQNIFENLFRNAAEHNSPPLTVEVGLLDDSSGFYVADDGEGIPDHRREEVFEFGYSTTADGTGFGLAIVREFVEAHGWEISVTGPSDDGARFEIRTE